MMEITTLGIADRAIASDILARAFHDDPVMNWVCDKPGFLQLAFDMVLPVFLPHGLSFIAGEGKGVAAWLGPGTKLVWPFNLANLVKLVRYAGWASLYRFAMSGIKIDKYHPVQLHYYLFAIGAVPECKGQGVGSALISRVLRQCDAEKIPAYLENSKEENLPFYRGHGFEVQRKICFGKGAPPLWLMWREPQESGGTPAT